VQQRRIISTSFSFWSFRGDEECTCRILYRNQLAKVRGFHYWNKGLFHVHHYRAVVNGRHSAPRCPSEMIRATALALMSGSLRESPRSLCLSVFASVPAHELYS